MANGISIHIGLNYVDPTHYQGWDGKLKGCENDARALEAIARKRKFTTNLLLNEQATANNVRAAIADAANQLNSGDILLLTYSGHGGQTPDPTEEEEDHMDETWVLYDRQLIDDELYALWGHFENDVRIFMLSDSCHSGSVAREFRESPIFESLPATNVPVPRAMPEDIQERTYRANREQYQQVKAEHPQGDRVGIGASVILISGCQDNQVSLDGTQNGLFTGTLLRVWNKGKFKGDIRKFHKKVSRRSSSSRAPTSSRLVAPIRRLSSSARSPSDRVTR
ncbi:MAG: caspase family protein [Caldilinea sp.]